MISIPKNSPFLLLCDALICKNFNFLDAVEFLNNKILCRKIKELKQVNNYKPFCMIANRGTDKMLRCLSTLPLQRLDVSFCYQITDQGLPDISTIPLQHIDLLLCNQITDQDLPDISGFFWIPGCHFKLSNY
jgi:hypothetical protein